MQDHGGPLARSEVRAEFTWSPIAFFEFIAAGYIEPWKPGSHAQNSVVMQIIGDAASCFAKAGYATILDGILTPGWFFEPVRDALGWIEVVCPAGRAAIPNTA